LKSFEVVLKKTLSAGHAVVVLLSVGLDRQAAISFLQSVLFIVSTVMSATGSGPFHTYDQGSTSHGEGVPQIGERSPVGPHGRIRLEQGKNSADQRIVRQRVCSPGAAILKLPKLCFAGCVADQECGHLDLLRDVRVSRPPRSARIHLEKHAEPL
jgi:hypothetical protein